MAPDLGVDLIPPKGTSHMPWLITRALLILGLSAVRALTLSPAVTPACSSSSSSAAARSPSPLMGRFYAVDDRILLVDGDNLMSHRKVTKGRDELAAKLTGIRGMRTVIVFDGRRGEASSTSGSDPQVVVTSGGDDEGVDRETADDWIERAIDEATQSRIEVVTADRRLREIAHSCKAKTINPAKFWRRYLPRLKGLKTDYSNAPKVSAD